MKKTARGSATAAIIVLVFACVAALLVMNRQRISDQILFWQYKPTAAVQQLAKNSGLNDRGTFYLYVAQPLVESKASFGTVCQNQDPTTAVLGCYVNDRIYVYDVTDERLKGVKAVTAAHEMLHAVYARLSDSEKKRVNSMVETAYASVKDQDDLRARMAVYAKTEPGERDNELHSVLGTEVGSLPTELENYYKQYFQDRQESVRAHAAYQSVFTTIQDKAKQLEAELTHLQSDIESSKQQYEQHLAATNAQISSFNARAREGGGFASEGEFTRTRLQLVAAVDELSQERATINAMIETFNAKNSQLAQLDTQVQELNQSIDSSLPTVPTLQ